MDTKCTVRVCADRASAINPLPRKDILSLSNPPQKSEHSDCYHWDLNLGTCHAKPQCGKAVTVGVTVQEELVGGKYMRAPADASLADKGRAKGKKATKRAGATALQGFRKYSSPSDIQVSTSCTPLANAQCSSYMAVSK